MWVFWMLRAQRWTPLWMFVSHLHHCHTCSSPHPPIRSSGLTHIQDSCSDRWKTEEKTLRTLSIRFQDQYSCTCRFLRCISIRVCLWRSVKMAVICWQPVRTLWRCGTTTCTWTSMHRSVCSSAGFNDVQMMNEIKNVSASPPGVHWSLRDHQAGEVHTWSDGCGHCGRCPVLLGLPGTSTGSCTLQVRPLSCFPLYCTWY